MLVALLCASAFQVEAPAVPATEPRALERVVVIGASLSAGFGAEQTLAQVFAAALKPGHAEPVDYGDALFFTSPLSFGARMVEAALDEEPSLVLAVDFLFWFGYGSTDAEGGAMDSEDERLALLEHGLAFLARLECPLVVGDFPDMSEAVGRMISPAQMPEKATLPRLSQRVREWAAKRGRTLVLPLSELVQQLGGEREVRIGRHLYEPKARLLQADRLHPTRRGQIAIAELVASELVRLEWAKEEDLEFDLAALELNLGRSRPR